MLKILLWDAKGVRVTFTKPLKLSFEASEDAPADRLTAMFAVRGSVPVLRTAEMWEGERCVFRGPVDTQTEEQNREGLLLTVSARSLAGVLLDQEALPQTYCMPSMSLLMQRHFAPLGFSYQGEDLVWRGEMTVSKGMSEWTVLKSFCGFFEGLVPRITPEGEILLVPKEPDTVVLGRKKLLSVRHCLNSRVLVSEVRARTCIDGGYEMKLPSALAQACGVKRVRYVNSIDSKSRTVLTAGELLRRAEDSYEQLVLDYGGRLLCEPGCRLLAEGQRGSFLIRELNYTLDSTGENTVIRAGREREE